MTPSDKIVTKLFMTEAKKQVVYRVTESLYILHRENVVYRVENVERMSRECWSGWTGQQTTGL